MTKEQKVELGARVTAEFRGEVLDLGKRIDQFIRDMSVELGIEHPANTQAPGDLTSLMSTRHLAGMLIRQEHGDAGLRALVADATKLGLDQLLLLKGLSEFIVAGPGAELPEGSIMHPFDPTIKH